METITDPRAMQAWGDDEHAAGRRIALVPTMGALHEDTRAGPTAHKGRRVVVSVFVNPMQFNRRDDFERYPRVFDEDAASCASAGVDASRTAGRRMYRGLRLGVESPGLGRSVARAVPATSVASPPW